MPPLNCVVIAGNCTVVDDEYVGESDGESEEEANMDKEGDEEREMGVVELEVTLSEVGLLRLLRLLPSEGNWEPVKMVSGLNADGCDMTKC
jgi:hypothetical protein